MSVAEKTCGTCKACCEVLHIDTPEFKKSGGKLCQHYSGGGCGIYATRYPICRQFMCGWLLFPELARDWRPDKSGVLVLQEAQANLPEPYRPAGNGVQFLILGGETAIARPGFAEFVAKLVCDKVGVYLIATQPRLLVNEHLEAMAQAGDIEGVMRTLRHLYRLLMAARARKSVFGMLPHLYRMHVERLRLSMKKPNK